MTTRRAEVLLVAVTVFWGATFAFIKNEMIDTQPSVFVALRFGVASLLGFALWHRHFLALSTLARKRGIILGGLYGTGFLLQTVGMQYTTASASAFITGAMVVFVPIVNRLVHGTQMRFNHLASVVLVLVGLWFFTSPQEHGVNTGDVITLISSVLWAVYLTYIDVWTRELEDQPSALNALVVVQFTVTLVLALVVVAVDYIRGVNVVPMFDTQLVIALGYCAIIASLIATFIQTRYQHYTHPIRAGVIFALEPLAAAVIAWFLLGERFTAVQFLGAVVLLAGTIVPDLIATRMSGHVPAVNSGDLDR